MAARRRAGDAGSTAGVVAFSGWVRGRQLRAGDMVVPYVAMHAARCDAARLPSGLSFSKRANKFRRTIFSRAAETQGTLCGQKHKHLGTGASFRGGSAATTLVRGT